MTDIAAAKEHTSSFFDALTLMRELHIPSGTDQESMNQYQSELAKLEELLLEK